MQTLLEDCSTPTLRDLLEDARETSIADLERLRRESLPSGDDIVKRLDELSNADMRQALADRVTLHEAGLPMTEHVPCSAEHVVSALQSAACITPTDCEVCMFNPGREGDDVVKRIEEIAEPEVEQAMSPVPHFVGSTDRVPCADEHVDSKYKAPEMTRESIRTLTLDGRWYAMRAGKTAKGITRQDAIDTLLRFERGQELFECVSCANNRACELRDLLSLSSRMQCYVAESAKVATCVDCKTPLDCEFCTFNNGKDAGGAD